MNTSAGSASASSNREVPSGTVHSSRSGIRCGVDIEAGASVLEISSVTGHSDGALVKQYADLGVRHHRTVVDSINLDHGPVLTPIVGDKA